MSFLLYDSLTLQSYQTTLAEVIQGKVRASNIFGVLVLIAYKPLIFFLTNGLRLKQFFIEHDTEASTYRSRPMSGNVSAGNFYATSTNRLIMIKSGHFRGKVC